MSIVHQATDISSFSGQVVYELRIVLIPEEEDGGFSAIARDLPGVASQGDTIDEAIDNVREAFRGAFEHYRDNSRNIPWRPEHLEVPPNAEERWVLVDG